jgi:hypothetical protein
MALVGCSSPSAEDNQPTLSDGTPATEVVKTAVAEVVPPESETIVEASGSGAIRALSVTVKAPTEAVPATEDIQRLVTAVCQSSSGNFDFLRLSLGSAGAETPTDVQPMLTELYSATGALTPEGEVDLGKACV